MKLRNKKTGEIGNLVLNINPNRESYSVLSTENGDTVCGNLVLADYDSLAELNEEWEDAPEELKKHYEILGIGVVIEQEDAEDEIFRNQNQREIGNYFESEEEAEKAVEKLKALKRLKENGFKFTEWGVGFDNNLVIKAKYTRGQIYEDMNLLFGGEECNENF